MPRPTPSQINKTIAQALSRLESAHERAVLLNYVAALKEIRNMMSVVFEKYADDAGQLTYAEMTRYNRLNSLEKQISGIMLDTYKLNGKEVKKLAAHVYEESYFHQAWGINQQAGIDINWGLLNVKAIEAAVANPLKFIALEGMTKNGIVGIRRTVTQGLIQGRSYPKMARDIKKWFDIDTRKFVTIVRTEGQRAQVIGQQDLYTEAEDEGIEMAWIWDATLDASTRPAHAVLDGIPAETDGDGGHYWDTEVGQVSGPLQSGYAEFDINCRCRVRGEIADYAPKLRRIRDEGIQPYVTFTDWAEPKGWTREKGWPKK